LRKKSSRNRAGIYLSVLLVLMRGMANAHEERPPIMPDGSGHVPTYRTTGPTLLVCKTDAADFAARIASFDPALKAENEALFGQCQVQGFRDLQAAVNAVQTPGVTIKVLPGLYQELPSLPGPLGACASLPAPKAKLEYQILSWDQQNQCPNNQNLVAIFSKTDLQIEGTGAKPTDVIFDAQFQRLNALRADRSNGIYIKNIAAERTTFNAFYIMETDGFVLDSCLGRWNDEYGFLTIADNNADYYAYVRDGTCNKPQIDRGYENGVVCPCVGIPTGTGVINAGGDWNIWQHNWVYGNHYAGFILTWAPGLVRNAKTWAAQFDTSHHNRYLGNSMGVAKDGMKSPNGIDFWWDGQGIDNCWQSSRPSGTEPLALPTCGSGWSVIGPGTARYVNEPMKLISLLNCARYDLVSQTVPCNCQWFGAKGFSRLGVQISTGEGVLTVLLVA